MTPHLEARLDGELDPTLARQVEVHLSACPRCRAEAAQLESLGDALRQGSRYEPSEALDERVMRSFRARHRPPAAVTCGAGWRGFILRRMSVPAPALALMLLLVIAAPPAAFMLGQLTAAPTEGVAPPPLVSDAPRSLAVPAAGDKEARVSEARAVPRTPAPRRARPVSRVRPRGRFESPPLRSYTGASTSEVDYSTTAALRGFEPLTTSTVRIIRGGER